MSQPSFLTVGSLFTGIGGIDLGLERTGRYQIVWQVEIDRYCQKVLAKHWPDIARYGDIRSVGKHCLSRVDVLVGGFPCQDISPAGKRRGIEGARSGLWAEFSRLIRELRPTYVIVENSSDLLKRGMGRVLGDLAACGYDAQWQILSASAFGAPHLRERTFIVAYSNGKQYNASTQPTIDSASGTKTSLERICSNVAHADSDRWQALQQEPGLLQTSQGSRVLQPPHRNSIILRRPIEQWDIWANEPDVGRVADGVPSRMDRLRGLGNAVVPQVAQYIGSCIARWHDANEQCERGAN